MHTTSNLSSSSPASQADIVSELFAWSDLVRSTRKGSPAPKKKAAAKKTSKKPAAKKAAKKASAKSAASTKTAKKTASKPAVKKTTKKAAKTAGVKTTAKKNAPVALTKGAKKPAAAPAPSADLARDRQPAPSEKSRTEVQRESNTTPPTAPRSAPAAPSTPAPSAPSRPAQQPPKSPAPAPKQQTPQQKPSAAPNTQPSTPSNAKPSTAPSGKPAAPVIKPGTPNTKPASAPSNEPHVEEPADEVLPGPHGREQIFEQSTTFADLGLRQSVLRGIEDAGFKHPTTIQAKLIPEILTGQDVLGQAKTGTGKTASFGLPMLHALDKGVPFQGLILVPTRELAIQVDADLKKLGKHTPIRSMPVYGGQNVRTQAERLAKNPEIVVATPGRIMDMANRGYIHYRNVKMVVLDEVDRMLDIGFRDDIRKILSACPKHPHRQTVFVSATISGDIEKLAHTHAHNAKKVIASAGSLTVAMVKQFYLPVERWDKRRLLLHVLKHEEPALTVVFCRMKRTVDDVAKYLASKGVDVHAIHGDMYQSSRNKVIEKLRAGDLSVLVASDLAARGLDVEGITHVINYDLPEDPDIYVHRIGRTARAGRDGVAWAFVTPEQGPLLTEIELLINAEIPKLDYPDFVPGPVPQDIQATRDADSARRSQAPTYNRYSQSAPPRAAALQSHAGAGAVGGSSNGSSNSVTIPTDHSRFPGGIVPTKLPPRMLQGRIKTARSLKQSMRPAPVAASAAPAHPPVVQSHRPHTP